jgi:hypothetical protein
VACTTDEAHPELVCDAPDEFCMVGNLAVFLKNVSRHVKWYRWPYFGQDRSPFIVVGDCNFCVGKLIEAKLKISHNEEEGKAFLTELSRYSLMRSEG